MRILIHIIITNLGDWNDHEEYLTNPIYSVSEHQRRPRAYIFVMRQYDIWLRGIGNVTTWYW